MSGMATPRVHSVSRDDPRADLRRARIDPDQWYPLALSRDLPRQRLRAASFAGEPIVLARGRSGRVFALEDRCRHRQMPLSMGVVRGDRLVCGYHAWVYGESGRCLGIPNLPAGQPRPDGVRAYPCREANGLVFVFPGDAAVAERVPLPDVPHASDPRYAVLFFDRVVACHYSFMHENLMDMSHQFLHRRLLGDITPSVLATRRDEDSVEVDYHFAETGGRQHWGARLLVRGESSQQDFEDAVLMTIATRYPHQTLRVRLPEREHDAIHLWASYVPVDREQRRSRSFGVLCVRRPRIPGLMALFRPVIRRFTEAVFAQDRAAVESEQRAHDAQGADWNHEVSPLILDLKALLRSRSPGAVA